MRIASLQIIGDELLVISYDGTKAKMTKTEDRKVIQGLKTLIEMLESVAEE